MPFAAPLPAEAADYDALAVSRQAGGEGPVMRRAMECAAASRCTRARSISAVTTPGSVAAIGQHAAPRVDDQRMAIAFGAARQRAALAGRDHIGAVLDGAGPLQHVPVRLAGDPREGGGCRQHLGARLSIGAVEMRESGCRSRSTARSCLRRRARSPRSRPGRDGGGLVIDCGPRRGRCRRGGSCHSAPRWRPRARA